MTILERVDVDRINARARSANPGRVLVTVITTFFWLIGWVIAKTAGYTWFAFAWTGAAIAEGFGQGFKDTPWAKARETRAALRAARRG